MIETYGPEASTIGILQLGLQAFSGDCCRSFMVHGHSEFRLGGGIFISNVDEEIENDVRAELGEKVKFQASYDTIHVCCYGSMFMGR